MKLIKFIRRLLRKYKKPPDPIAEAFAEGIREALRKCDTRLTQKIKI